MTNYAYLRVSTVLQDTDKNKLEILKFANSHKLGNVEFIEEHVTSKKHYKQRLIGQLLENIKQGDVLIVPELSRLARSVSQIFEIIDMSQQKGFTLYSMKENFCTSDKTITSIVTSTVFALVAQIERELISLRTKEALHAKQLNGLKLGRPQGKGKSKLDEHKDTIIKLLDCGVPKTLIAKQFNTSTVNLYKFLKYNNKCA